MAAIRPVEVATTEMAVAFAVLAVVVVEVAAMYFAVAAKAEAGPIH